MQVTCPGRISKVKKQPSTPQEQDGYFLFFKLRTAQINKPMVSITINSSYVLIIITTFQQDSERDESTSSGCPDKHIMLSQIISYNFVLEISSIIAYNMLIKTAGRKVTSSCSGDSRH